MTWFQEAEVSTNDRYAYRTLSLFDFSSVNVFLKANPKPAWDGKDLLIMSKYVIVACHYLRYSISRQEYCNMKSKKKGSVARLLAIEGNSLPMARASMHSRS
jgi:hypothetical protein